MVTGRSGLKPVQFLPSFGDRRRRRIGILGGSFNPAHEGHLHISREALKRLNLDQVWWLVSPQNPLKALETMAQANQRLAIAKTLAAADPRILVTDVEQRMGDNRTAHSLQSLCRHYPNLRFVWLMGSDNLAEIPRWWRWTSVFNTVRVAVLDRSPYSYISLGGSAVSRYARFRAVKPLSIWFHSPPSWTYITIRRHPASATEFRAKLSLAAQIK